MTTFGSGGYHGLSWVAETTFGTTPGTPSMVALRHTSCSLILTKDTFQSAELRSDRQISDFRHGNKRASGDIGIEFSFAEFDTFIEAALGGTWQSAMTVSGTDIQAVASGKYVKATTTTFTSKFAAGDVVGMSGWSQTTNNDTFVITTVAATRLTFATVPGTLVNGAAGSTVTITLDPSVDVGITKRSFTIEREFSDITLYARFTGCRINTWTLSIKPNAIVTGTFGVIGKLGSYHGTALDASIGASQTASPYDSFTGAVYENDVASALITSIEMNLNNNADATFVVGSATTPEIVWGRSNLTGTLECYFQDTTMLNKFVNETESSIEVYLGDGSPGTDSYRIYIPRVKFGSGENSVSGEGPITVRMSFQALYDSTEGTNLRITKIT